MLKCKQISFAFIQLPQNYNNKTKKLKQHNNIKTNILLFKYSLIFTYNYNNCLEASASFVTEAL